MKKILVFLTLFTYLVMPPITFAQMTESSGVEHAPIEIAPEISPYDLPAPTLPVFGQDHAYSVTLRGNGEGMVNMRVSFSNFDPGELDMLVLKSDSIMPTEVAAFQIIKEKVCTQFDTAVRDFTSSSGEVQSCLSYSEPNYYEMWGVNNKYLRAQADIDGNTITVTLPEPVKEGKSGSYVLFMRVPELSTKVFGGAYKYSFETFTTGTAIRNITIGISSDSDMKFKGAEGMVAYEDKIMRSTFTSAISSKQPSFQSPDLDNYVYQIGYGQVNKSTQDLAAGDTYTVSGTMGKSLVNLYLREALIVAAIVLAIFGIIISLAVYLSKKKNSSPPSQKASGSKLFIISISMSFVAVLMMVGMTLVLFAVSKILETWGMYGQGMFIFLLVAIVAFGIYAFLLIAPSAIMWMKYGKKWAAIAFGLTFFWIMTFLVIIGIYVMFTGVVSNGIGAVYKIEPAVESYSVTESSL